MLFLRAALFIFFLSLSAHGAERVVSLAPSITEIVFKLGGKDRLAGVTSMCDYPPEAKKLEKIGSYFRPSFEKIISLHPDLVLGVEEGFGKPVKQRLDTAGIKNRFYPTESLNDILFMIKDTGILLGLPYEKITADIQKVFAEKPPVKARGIMLVNLDPVIAVGGGVFINDILACGGFDNLLKNSGAKYPGISLEAVYRLKPQYILYSRMDSSTGLKTLKQKLDRTGLQTVYLALNPDIFNRASYRAADACLFLRKNLR